MKLSQEEKDAIANGSTFYNLQVVGIYAYMVRIDNEHLRPDMTVAQMMNVFKSSDRNLTSQFRSNRKMGTISYNFNKHSITPPSASHRPANGLRSITDLFKANDTTIVWQFYRSAICKGDRGIYLVRLFNDPAQQSYFKTTLNEREDKAVPSGSKVLGYRVVWRPIAIQLTPEGEQKRKSELEPEEN